ncbi:hypothetical protein EYM_00755 [Ignicoccus islandicus DSM 13165]|uniref:ABC transmembrane type-1 domain-containing protein n=1 Tax=Ignicoccus islandicus DSM 13165 TaxID=940295 RepID=A0A0U3G1D3_9CREN|nr:ABC transporter permease subunit [Ignicoccus islandicus]ALU12140.1 hypothetical protein EYM_00755 [Ignicoccus islandicus DSM 13165]
MKAFAFVMPTFLLMIIILPLFSVPLRSVASALLDPETLYAFQLSVFTASVATALALLVAIPSGYSLSKGCRFSRVLKAISMIPLALPPVALGALLLIFFSRTPLGNLVNSVIPIVFNVPGLIVAQFVVAYPISLRVIESSMHMLDEELLTLSRVYGCDGLCLIRKVILPIIAPGLRAASLLSFARSLGEFGASVTLAGAIRFKTETLPIAIYLTLSSGELEKTLALIFVTAMLSLILFIIGEGNEGAGS